MIVIGPDGSTALGTVPGAMPPPGALLWLIRGPRLLADQWAAVVAGHAHSSLVARHDRQAVRTRPQPPLTLPSPHPAGAPAGASAAAAPPARPSPSLAERRAAEALRAAYIAELEEREANRHSYARRNGGLAGSSMGWSALSFLPFLV